MDDTLKRIKEDMKNRIYLRRYFQQQTPEGQPTI